MARKYGCSRKMNQPTIIVESNDLEILSSSRDVAFVQVCTSRRTYENFGGAIARFKDEKREVDTTIIRRAHRIVVDSREDCLEEAGDLIIPNAEINAEIGEILNGDKPGRQSDDEITFFKSVGVAVQDAVAGAVVLAESKGLGTVFFRSSRVLLGVFAWVFLRISANFFTVCNRTGLEKENSKI